jgi:hypothetical protein|tara:strand:- start:744 stop:980 length:237 start_codon:yes stop_codon:yes gene_type:complete
MPEEEIEMTAEDIARHYSASMDSVNLINAVLASPDDYADDPTVLQRNIDHLKGTIVRDIWTTEDMTPFNDAIAAGEAA